VLEYVWKAAWCFYPEADPAAEAWVRHQALAVLDGKATQVAGVIRRKATTAGLDRARRKSADEAASYLTKKARYLDYPTALNNGWPIATGVIEGACRHIVAGRLDITGARWGLEGAEAILKLRALRSNKDFDAYWLMPLTETAQSCSPKLLTLSGRQSSGQRSGIVITSSSAGVSAASNRSGIATGSSQCGQSPPTPTRRQGRTHPTHHCSPR
jgi:hypothetical protein